MPADGSVFRATCIDGLLSVKLTGDITFREWNLLKEQIHKLYAENSAIRLEIDFIDVLCIDSSGLALLVASYKLCQGHISVILKDGSQPARILKRANIIPYLNVSYRM